MVRATLTNALVVVVVVFNTVSVSVKQQQSVSIHIVSNFKYKNDIASRVDTSMQSERFKFFFLQLSKSHINYPAIVHSNEVHL